MTKAHTLSASQVAAFPNVLKSQETMDPMIPGRAAAALPAKLARARPRACSCYFDPLPDPPLSGGLGAGDGVSPLLRQWEQGREWGFWPDWILIF